MIFTYAYVPAGMVDSTPLPDKDVPSPDQLSAEQFYAQSFTF